MKTFTIPFKGVGQHVGYEMFRYPAGELQVRLLNDQVVMENLESFDAIRVEMHTTAIEDLFGLALLADALTALPHRRSLFIPYLPFARADRRFVKGDCFGLWWFGQFLNAMKWDSVQVIDPHNKAVAENMIERLICLQPYFYINKAVHHFVEQVASPSDPLYILFPDEGSLVRYSISEIAPDLTFRHLACSKRRDPLSGRLLGFNTPEVPYPLPPMANVMIIDDICDGGGTFCGIYQGLLNAGFRGRIALYVTHGIFSNNALQSLPFDRIYTTNSFKDWKSNQRLVAYDVFGTRSFK